MKTNTALCEILLKTSHLLAMVLKGNSVNILTLQTQKINNENEKQVITDLLFNTLRDYYFGDYILSQLVPNLQNLYSNKNLQIRALLVLTLSALKNDNKYNNKEFVVVNECIKAVKKLNYKMAGFCNAILRNFLRQQNKFLSLKNSNKFNHNLNYNLQQANESQLQSQSQLQLQFKYSHPFWWIEKLQQQFKNNDDVLQILDAGNSPPPMNLRINLLQTNKEKYSLLLKKFCENLVENLQNTNLITNFDTIFDANFATNLDNDYSIYVKKPIAKSNIPNYNNGDVSIQDFAAQLANEYLFNNIQNNAEVMQKFANKNEIFVLDACAAPGNKTAHLIEKFIKIFPNKKLNLIACELDKNRCESINKNLQRLNLTTQNYPLLNVKILHQDCQNFHENYHNFFDIILADVPCSASGVVRRNPDIKWLRKADDIAKFAKQQQQIIQSLWKLLNNNFGVFFYATCSVFAEENTLQIQKFLDNYKDEASLKFQKLLLPTNTHDGFFYSCLLKNK